MIRSRTAACQGGPPAAPLTVARQFAHAIADTKLVVIPGCGHLSNLEQPEKFNEAVRAFCRAHSPQ
jgi:pimeloyl-ACP methyl ester carboxylesterase